MNLQSSLTDPIGVTPPTATIPSLLQQSILPPLSATSFLPLPDPPNIGHNTTTNPTSTKQQSGNSASNHKPPRRFSCTVCNIDLANQKHFNSHLNSRPHQQAQSIHEVLQSIAPEFRAAYKAMFSPEMLNKKVFNRVLHCEEEFKQTKEPVLGLNYIIEFQFENIADPPQYICDLCECKCSAQTILSHVLNIVHQRKFLKIHHPDMYERVSSASNVRSEQQRLMGNCARQIESRHGGRGNVKLHIQLDSFIGQRPIVLAVTFKTQSANAKGSRKLSFQLTSKTFEEYDYQYEEVPITTPLSLNSNGKYPTQETLSEQKTINYDNSVPRGVTAEDLLYPFERQFWYDNYKDLLESRPIDPHSVTFQETTINSNTLQAFRGVLENRLSNDSSSSFSPLSIVGNDAPLSLENGQTIRRNTNQPSNRRVILDSNRITTTNNGSISIVSPTKTKSVFDGYTLLNQQQTISNGGILNEQSARAILAASGLLQSDEDDEQEMETINDSNMTTTSKINGDHLNGDQNKKKFDQTVSPLIAKRMLDAVLSGDLDVSHIQPYFSSLVNLIQTGQVDLERNQAERLLHKILVTSSKTEITINNNNKSRSHSRGKQNYDIFIYFGRQNSTKLKQNYSPLERHSSHSKSSTSNHQHRSSNNTDKDKRKKSSDNSPTTRRVHVSSNKKTGNGKRSFS